MDGWSEEAGRGTDRADVRECEREVRDGGWVEVDTGVPTLLQLA